MVSFMPMVERRYFISGEENGEYTIPSNVTKIAEDALRIQI